MTIKEGDFVNVDYTGKVDGKVFDTTSEEIAKKEGIYSKNTKYGSITIVVGAGHLIKGIDEALVGKNVGDEFTIIVTPEKAFGKKNPKLLKIIPQKIFKEQKVDAYPGMTVSVDNLLGTVVSVSAGRVIVDFNHPLAGKELEYKIKINKLVEDKKEQVAAIVELYGNVSDCEIELKENEVSIKCNKELPENAKTAIQNDIKKYIKLERINFVKPVKKE
ncbi:MAG: peptidylprolyl isomerase [Nanoarchaeota archaeon]|nr:peptidylprolyl isomerase [Nanoarchaeota archaeon]